MLTKLLVTVAVVLAVLFGFRAISQLTAGAGRGGTRRPRLPAQDMVKCPTCETFVTSEAPSGCDRPDCPYR